MRVWKHVALTAAALFLTLGLPALLLVDWSALHGDGSSDGVSGASLVLPEQPSGEFVVLINEKLHPDTMEDWTRFFTNQPVEVIMEDISCMVVAGDQSGEQLADRYQARLAEHQMTIRRENPIMAASKADCGRFDVMILSREIAEGYRFSTALDDQDVSLISVKGEGQ